MSESQFSPTELATDEELVAYLDGELDPAEQVRIERRLADDEQYRARLAELQRAWDLLDSLERTDVGDDFTRDTVEMVALQAADDVQRAEVRKRRTRWLLLGTGGGAIVASALLGYSLLSQRLQEPNEQLVEDLPVIERVDEYRNAESVEFLRQLAENGLFVEGVDDAP